MTTKYISTFNTKFGGKKSPAHTTVCTYVFPDGMPGALIPGWVDSANIVQQSRFRRAKSAPASITVNAMEFASHVGARSGVVTVDSVAAQLSALSPADLRRALALAEKSAAKPAKPAAPKTDAKPTENAGEQPAPKPATGDGEKRA